MGPGMGCPGDSVPLRSTPAPPNVSCVPLRGTCIRRAPPPIFVRGWTNPRTPHTQTLSVRRHLGNLVDLQILVIIQSIIGSPGTPSRRRVHPRTRAGGGARQLQVICAANDAGDGGRGRSGARQRGAESSGMVFPDSRTHQYAKKEDDLQSLRLSGHPQIDNIFRIGYFLYFVRM